MDFRPIDVDKDMDLILHFRRDSYIVSFGTDEPFGDGTGYLNRIRERVKKFPEGLVILEQENRPIGQMELQILVFEGREIGYVNLYYLIPEFRGAGFGKKLIDYAEEVFRNAGVTEYQLRVSSTNERAIKFYQKWGMEKIREEMEGYLVWRMRKFL